MGYATTHANLIGALTLQHLAMVAAAMTAALAFAVPVGILIAAHRKAALPVLGVLGALYTIPSLALFALLIPVLGLGFWTAVVALAAYAQMVLVRNTAAALGGIDPAVIDAARGIGMSASAVLWRVQRPLAMPVFLAGVRVATVSVISIGTVAAWINAGGLGTLVLDGIEHDYPAKAVAGALAAVVLAFAADVALRRIQAASGRWAQTTDSHITGP